MIQHDRANLVVTRHGFIHDIENGLQSLQAQFRIAQPIDEAGRIADIRKQDGKPFALATFGMKRPEGMLPGLIGYACQSAKQQCSIAPKRVRLAAAWWRLVLLLPGLLSFALLLLAQHVAFVGGGVNVSIGAARQALGGVVVDE